MGNERLYDTFARLCEIRSPTGEEREVADTLAAELRALGLDVEEDDVGRVLAGAQRVAEALDERGAVEAAEEERPVGQVEHAVGRQKA